MTPGQRVAALDAATRYAIRQGDESVEAARDLVALTGRGALYVLPDGTTCSRWRDCLRAWLEAAGRSVPGRPMSRPPTAARSPRQPGEPKRGRLPSGRVKMIVSVSAACAEVLRAYPGGQSACVERLVSERAAALAGGEE